MAEENMDEKYKPTSVDQIVGQPHVIKRAQGYVRKGMMPHLLLAGPPGVGKTSLVHALAHQLFGPNWEMNLTVFNASTSRGIDFIREEVTNLTLVDPIGARFHIIFLDECDALTSDAQTALRETMQKHTATCKFILGCNYINNIIEPIQDRCRVFRFRPIPPADIFMRIRAIADAENGDISDDALKYIADHSKGSLRTALNHLETYLEEGIHIDLETVEGDMPDISNEDAKYLFEQACAGNIEKYEERLFTLHYTGFSSEEILDSILSLIDKQPTSIRKILVPRIGEFNWRISQGSNEILQMRCFLRSLEGVV